MSLQMILTIFYLLWLVAVLVLLFGIWRITSRYMKQMEKTIMKLLEEKKDASTR